MKEDKNKKEQLIYCICVILALILVTFGDQIMLHIIPQKPNANNTLFGGSKKEELTYKNPYLTKMSAEQMLEKLEKKESFIVIFTRLDCSNCNSLINDSPNLFQNAIYPVYYIDRDTYNENREVIKQIANYDQVLKENIDLTPYLVKIEDGKIVSSIPGTKAPQELENFLKQKE